MITCLLKIKEVPNKGVWMEVVQVPDQSTATPIEMHVASLINSALAGVAKQIIGPNGKVESLMGEGAFAQELGQARIKQFESLD